MSDLEYLIECAVMSTFKLHSIDADIFAAADLSKFVSENFEEDKRITFPQLLKFFATDSNADAFRKFFKIPEISRKYLNRVEKLLATASENLLNPELTPARLSASIFIKS